jgi:transcriptional regulator of arginine metabolism
MKTKRQSKILEIIQTRQVETQEDLMRALQECGFPVTQATVSRDIKELRLIKVQDGEGVYRYSVVNQESKHISSKFSTLFHDAVMSIDYACNLVVVKCHAGMAQAACAAMDSLHWPTVIGTLAGDDTFVCITKTAENAVVLVEELKKWQQQS